MQTKIFFRNAETKTSHGMKTTSSACNQVGDLFTIYGQTAQTVGSNTSIAVAVKMTEDHLEITREKLGYKTYIGMLMI